MRGSTCSWETIPRKHSVAVELSAADWGEACERVGKPGRPVSPWSLLAAVILESESWKQSDKLEAEKHSGWVAKDLIVGTSTANLSYAMHELGEDGSPNRWPESDEEWVEGGIDDVADAIEALSLSGSRIREGGEILEIGVRDASRWLEQRRSGLAFGAGMAGALHQVEGEQTTRIAVSIIVNAFVFHYAIEGQEGIPGVAKGQGKLGFQKNTVLAVWDEILEVNYWPIFPIARDILEAVPARLAATLLDKGDEIAGALEHAHDK